MEAYLVKILTDNPWLIWVSLGLIVILAVVSVLRGGEVNLFGLKFGTKSPNPQSPANVSASGHTALSSHQTMPISIYTGPVDLDDKLIEKVYFRVKEKLDLENSSRPSYLDLLKGYPQPSSDYLLASSAQYAVRKKFEELKTIVYGDQTGLDFPRFNGEQV